MPLSRRRLLGLAVTLLPMVAVRPLALGPLLRHLLFAPRGETRPPKPLPPNPFTAEGKSLVALVRGAPVAQLLREGLTLLGGLERLPVAGKTVLVKPNVVADDPPPTTTSPELVAAVVQLLYAAGAARVVVGERSAILTLPTRDNLERTGVAHAAREAGAEVIAFEEAAWVRVAPPQAVHVPQYYVAQAAYDADVLINLPVLKTHRSASYTLSLKNLVGLVHPRYTPWVVDRAAWEEVIAELNLAVHPHLTIVDATRVMVAGGPWHGPTVAPGLLLLGGDRIAVDVVGLGLLKHFGQWPPVAGKGVWEQRQIRRAVALGLGAGDKTQVALRAPTATDATLARLLAAIEHHVFG
ncbi:MAG: hypothetical protein KatS3mg131_2725 [Candidatus Tectimicrobiota bacterium]|nr:MAG: hypothetical protein KatS3mg131_2725 [Candidatus Tectomicrobia bacterium]